jgi:hypothetical protein
MVIDTILPTPENIEKSLKSGGVDKRRSGKITEMFDEIPIVKPVPPEPAVTKFWWF